MTPPVEDRGGAEGNAERTGDEDLLAIAGSVADGSGLAWSVLYQSSGVPPDPAVVEELMVIAKVAQAHRDAAREAEAPQPLRPQTLTPDAPTTWAHLEVREPLGTGSFGTVYRAHDPQLRRDVALKIYRVDQAHREAMTELSSEGRLLARVHHPNVVTVFGVAQQGSEVGLWLELIEGRTLADEIKTTGPLGFRETALVGLELCRALAAVHQAGLVHRDIKPQNVMRERGGRIVLMDFGLGRDRDTVVAGDASGTPLYMAPELFSGEAHSVRSDIYSLGVLLFFLVTGTHPVRATSRSALERSHRDGQRQLLRDVRADLPDAFVDVIERACAADPSRRFATAGAMQAALSSVLGIAQQADRVIAGPTRWWMGRPTLIAAAVLVLAVLAGAVLVPRRGSSEAESSRATPVETRPLANAYEIGASFYRRAGDGVQLLDSDARVAPGDRLFVEIRATKSVYVYIVNQDDRGESYLLFPLPGQSLSNPLPAGRPHRVPGAQGGDDLYWQVTSAGGREHFVVVASPEPLAALETMLAHLPKPKPGHPVSVAEPLSNEVVGQLRGVGGLTTGPSSAGQRGSAGLLGTVPLLKAGSENATGTWMRQLTLQNPVR